MEAVNRIDRLAEACFSALDRAANAVLNAFDSFVEWTAYPFYRTWDAIVYDFPHWVGSHLKWRA